MDMDAPKDMSVHENRLSTFTDWPIASPSPASMAMAGFYYLGRGVEVRCAFCKVEMCSWKDGEDPASSHRRWAPQCPLFRDAAAMLDVAAAAHHKYAVESARLATFKNWPIGIRIDPRILADAGFFYTGCGDMIVCFFCGGGLKDWEAEDVPWEQHATWFSDCQYLKLVKGQEYVDKYAKRKEPESGSDDAQQCPSAAETPPDDAQQHDEASLCKICFDNERNVCFVPCGHVVACSKCAVALTKCPTCTRRAASIVRLYFS